MITLLLLTILSGVIAGLFGHPFGVAPILACLVIASCFFKRSEVVVIGLGTILIRDLILGIGPFTLVRMAAVLGVIGVLFLVRVRPAPKSLLVGLALGAPVYHLLLTVGNWVTQFCVLPSNATQGLWATLMSSLPYVQHSLVSNLFFTGVFLGLYLMAGRQLKLHWPALLPKTLRG